MQALEIIEQSQSGEAMAHLARIAGVTETEARAIAKVVVPELALALERNTLSRGGLADLVHALGQGHHEQILETPRAWSDPRVTADGEAVLAHILGSDGKARALAARASRAAGVGGGIVEMLLPILAQLLMGAIAKYAKGGLGDILSRLPIPGGGSPAPDRRDGGFDTGGAMGDRGGFELPKVDLPQGGFPMPPIPGSPDAGDRAARDPARDDPMRRPGGFEMPWPGATRDQPEPRDRRSRTGFDLPETSSPPPGGYPMPPIPQWPGDGSEQPPPRDEEGRSGFPFPFPQPGSGSVRRGNNPYGDLSDILRRRGGSLPSGNAASGGLWSVVRSVIGGALGFGNRGFIGWLIRFVVMRWGWRILQRVLLGRR